MPTEENIPTSAGLSSFNLLDEKKFFAALDLREGMTLLDLGCGVGNYAMAMTPYVGKKGHVYAMDPWEEGIETLEVRASMAGYKNIETVVLGGEERLPVNTGMVDVCLLGTVAHILVQEERIDDTLVEIQRVLKTKGRVAVVEFFKKQGPPGPPIEWRLSPEELEAEMARSGFQASGYSQVGQHNYLSIFICPH